MTELFTRDGEPAFGIYTGEIGELPLSRYATPGVPAWLRPWRIKRWRFVGLFAPNLTVGMAVVHTGYLGSAFVYAYDHVSGDLYEAAADAPLGAGTQISDHALEGLAHFSRGNLEIHIAYGAETTLTVRAKTPRGPLRIEAHLDERPSTLTPHQTITPTPTRGRFTFTHKAAGMPAWGEVWLGERRIVLERESAFAVTDHTAGVHDYRWVWDWACFGGLSREGRRVGLNLVSPVFHPTYNENALWVDGARIPVSAAHFEYDSKHILEPWRLTSEDGQVDLTFTPIGERAKNINALLIASAYHQPVGYFSGTFTLANGQKLAIEHLSGVVERHAARW